MRALELQPGHVVVDGTLGGGGHSRLILDALDASQGGRLIGLDRDPGAIERAQDAFPEPHAHLEAVSYADLRDVLDRLNIDHVDRILVDLGLSSDQLSDESRGFGFDSEGPLDLRFDPTSGLPAHEWITRTPSVEIESALTEYADEPFAGRIASALVSERPQTGVELAAVVRSAVPKSVAAESKKHPATRTFQALRIAVNDELSHLSRAVRETFPACLGEGGLLVAIAFHSIEDRILKHAFQGEESWRMLTKKPLTPTPSEARHNPRSRSARIRVARRV